MAPQFLQKDSHMVMKVFCSPSSVRMYGAMWQEGRHLVSMRAVSRPDRSAKLWNQSSFNDHMTQFFSKYGTADQSLLPQEAFYGKMAEDFNDKNWMQKNLKLCIGYVKKGEGTCIFFDQFVEHLV